MEEPLVYDTTDVTALWVVDNDPDDPDRIVVYTEEPDVYVLTVEVADGVHQLLEEGVHQTVWVGVHHTVVEAVSCAVVGTVVSAERSATTVAASLAATVCSVCTVSTVAAVAAVSAVAEA